jgi:cytochrome b561
MSSITRSPRYAAVAIALHWTIAIGIGFMIWLGWNMDGKESWFQFHKSVGITILILTVARIAWRLMNPPPPLPDDMTPLERRTSHAVHLAFYGLMLLMPLTGWLTVSTAYNFDIATVLYGLISWPDVPGVAFLSNETGHGIIANVHSKLAWVAIGLVSLHVAGALKHEIGGEEGVLKRMLPGLFGKTDRPSPPPHGFLVAFGAAIGVFVVIAFVPPLIAGNVAPASSATLDVRNDGGDAAHLPNWSIDYDASEIAFSGTHDGSTYSGTFSDWSADIYFDEDALDKAFARVLVRTASASANKKLYTDSLKSAEWLDPGSHQEAHVTLSDFKKTDGGYVTNATLELKDERVTVPFRFTLNMSDDTATMTGGATLERKPLNLGQSSDPNGDWVGETVSVDVTVRASRIDQPE